VHPKSGSPQGGCSVKNLDMVCPLGAVHVIDYKVEDFTQNGQQSDLILAVNGYHPISDYLRAIPLCLGFASF
jgi:hypothetical protein